MRRKEHKTSGHKRLRFHRKPLPLPYTSPPEWGPLRVAPGLRTASEIAGEQHHTAA
ncbi:MAG TPA: hypothetical protein VFB78_04985 [Acidimicrobiales bacterium]|nr:hypothetical protein [Acidimicrobiales bacterium]